MNNTIEKTIGSVSFNLRENHDFSWLKNIGEPFAVFDQQDSGNICFGVFNGSERLFVKYAGAKTIEFSGDTDDAVNRLKNAVQPYADLAHDSLVAYSDSFSIAEGFAVIFKWFDGENLHQHWKFPLPQKYTNPDSPFYRFKKLPVNVRLNALDKIFSFHAHVEQKHYVAVDFYDGSILYNFENNELKICDIDFYSKKPYVNQMCWGSRRFKSPEEEVKGSFIDETTNVYNMGATAFCLVGGELDRSFEKWESTEALYQIAKKATAHNRADRYDTVTEFYHEWKSALLHI